MNSNKKGTSNRKTLFRVHFKDKAYGTDDTAQQAAAFAADVAQWSAQNPSVTAKVAAEIDTNGNRTVYLRGTEETALRIMFDKKQGRGVKSIDLVARKSNKGGLIL